MLRPQYFPQGEGELAPLYEDARRIMQSAIEHNLPGPAVRRALQGHSPDGPVTLIAIGKAAYAMADSALECLGEGVCRGIVLTKYGHLGRPLPRLSLMEAGHPVPDENSVRGAEAILQMTGSLSTGDQVLLLLSGGASALFEKPLPGASLIDIQNITQALLKGGADIEELNTVRKHLSGVKGGRLALNCRPAQVLCIALSDVLGDAPGTIGSGPTAADPSTSQEALALLRAYGIAPSPALQAALMQETPKRLDNAELFVVGGVRHLCQSAAQEAQALGYNPIQLTAGLACEAAEAGRLLAAIARDAGKLSPGLTRPCALILGGETVVRVRGKGLGGRSQELALAAALCMRGAGNAILCAFGSDGTDGPTDAAGAIVDGHTAETLKARGCDGAAALLDNDAYHALEKVDRLIFTGPTGTNVNDLVMLLLK